MPNFTPRKSYPYPLYSTTVEGGPQDYHDFATVKDLMVEGQPDILSAGVQSESEWSSFVSGGISINSESGLLKVASSGGVAWVPDPFVTGALLRASTSKKEWTVQPATLPAVGKYTAISWEVTASSWNGGFTSLAHSSVECTSVLEAELAVREVTPGYIRLGTVVVFNKGAPEKYSLQTVQTASGLSTTTLPSIQVARFAGSSRYITEPTRVTSGGFHVDRELLLSTTRPAFVLATAVGQRNGSASPDLPSCTVTVGGRALFTKIKVLESESPLDSAVQSVCLSFVVPAGQYFTFIPEGGTIISMTAAYLLL